MKFEKNTAIEYVQNIKKALERRLPKGCSSFIVDALVRDSSGFIEKMTIDSKHNVQTNLRKK